MLKTSQPDTIRDRFVVVPHHPDRLRRPVPRAGTVSHERFLQALTWNVFRTLELIAPAFWLRRLHARLVNDCLPTAAQIVRVGLWRPLEQPPLQRLDGTQPPAIADVWIETEDAAWALIVTTGTDYDGAAARLEAVAAAGAWAAGARETYCGLIDLAPAQALAPGTLLRGRYLRSSHGAALRGIGVVRTSAAARVPGALDWQDLAAVLADCAASEVLPDLERAAARQALAWLDDVGIDAARSKCRT